MERLGFCFLDRPSVEKQIELVRNIERLGYESAWVTETRLARDAFTVLGAFAAVTARIKLRTCKKDYCATNPDTVLGFVRATLKGVKAMIADRKGAVASVMRRDPLLKENVELERNDLMIDGSLLTPWVKQNGISTVDRERFERSTAQVAEAFGVPVRRKMEDIYTERLPPKAERVIG